MGDFNGDGYADVLAGAPGYSNGQTGEGRAYVYYSNAATNGAAVISSSSPWIAESNETGANFGYSVAAGNADGDTNRVSEVIIGAPYMNYVDGGTTYTDAGMVYVFSATTGGGSVHTPSDPPYWSYGPSQSNAHFGWSVTFMDRIVDPDTLFFYLGLAASAPDEDVSGNTDYGTVRIWFDQQD